MQLDTPISKRVSRIVIAAVAIGISVSVGIFLFLDFRQAMKAEISRYQTAAYAFAAAASDGVSEKDPRKVLEVIRGVRNLPEVAYVGALDEKRNVIAEIGAGARLVGAQPLRWSLIPTAIEVSADVRKGGVSIGSITLHAEAENLLNRYISAILYAALLGVALVVVTAILARIQVGRVVRPLRDLSEEFLDIGRRSDLTRRLKKQRNDEVGVLVDAFNEMFGHINDRDRQLQRHRETLEETVDQRTAELRLAKEEADAANAAKSTFLATMSHEIRTPMNGMMVMAEMLAAAPLSPRHQRYAEIITRSGKNLVHIINDILDVSKIESGKIELEEIEFSFDSVIEDVACLFAERAREKRLSLAIFIAPDVPTKVVGDPVRLTQIVSNLVNNGLKFTEAGGVAIEVERDVETDNIAISVVDTGIGISPDQISRIFTRFSQADSSITRKFGGTGLGLSISKQLAELMGGKVRVESVVGEGSRFTVSVPLVTVEQPAMFSIDRRVTVTLCDDDVMSRRAVARALAARGVSVLEDDDAKSDAVFIRAGNAAAMATGEVPVVLLRPFAATASAIPAGVKPTIEVPLPLSRGLLDRLCKALENNQLADLDLAPSAAGSQSIPDLRHLKVLAVDDVAVNREVLAEALRTFNIDCDLAESALDAIARVRSRSYDVIFMDCSMPGMDGFEATREIRKMESETARPPALVVALTGHVMGKETGDWKDAGMNGYLAKPFNITQLSAAFRDFNVIAATVEATSAEERQDDPLLSSETLEMFDSIRASTGADVRTRVFAMFRDGALIAYRAAADEIANGGTEAKRLIHALKSNCSSTGAARATSICQAIETVLSSGNAPSPALIEALEDVLQATVAAMDELEAAASQAAA